MLNVCFPFSLRHKAADFYLRLIYNFFLFLSDKLDTNAMFENSLSAKEKIISDLNMELHNLETTLSNERDYHLNELKKLKALINEKVIILVFI